MYEEERRGPHDDEVENLWHEYAKDGAYVVYDAVTLIGKEHHDGVEETNERQG